MSCSAAITIRATLSGLASGFAGILWALSAGWTITVAGVVIIFIPRACITDVTFILHVPTITIFGRVSTRIESRVRWFADTFSSGGTVNNGSIGAGVKRATILSDWNGI